MISPHKITLQRFFIFSITSLCVTYFILQLFYIHYAMISVDEFWFAHHIYEFKHHLPYQDFAPYKTVLGYYLLLWPMTLSQHFLKPLIYTKEFIAFINGVLFLLTSFWLTRFFAKTAIMGSLMILIMANLVLNFSADIRVDLLSYWFCLFSVLCLLENRYLLAGFLIGIGFLISQKVLWYIAASNIALSFSWLLVSRDWPTLRNLIWFNIALLITVLIYILFWGLVTHFHTVIHSVFYEAYIMYKLDFYANQRKLFWTIILSENPLLFLLWPLTLLSLIIVPTNHLIRTRGFFVSIYSSVILFSLIHYKQVFPYYMVATIPAFFLLYSMYFTWLREIYYHRFKIIFSKISLWLLIGLYLVGLCYIIYFFHLAMGNILIGIIPVLIGLYCLDNKFQSYFFPLVIIPIIFVGLIYPLALSASMLPAKRGDYQQYMLSLITTLLDKHENYVAGIDLLYNRTQPIAGMQHLDMSAMEYLYHPSSKLRPIMLTSLNRNPNTTINQIMEDLQHTHVKLYVNNYRMMSLPPAIRDYLATQYEHFWGSIYLYAPGILAGTDTVFQIKFSGSYQVESRQPIMVDGKLRQANSVIYLDDGIHHSNAKESYRLKLQPEKSFLLNEAFRADDWQRMI